ncbi:hypothetical protein AN641_02490 [Candidatus Epulonipiscioides gigas]|nr:hypothetical protein AN641_02490 [Epulopiscium sp. SCG-C07WGA-EpuloA2]
MKTLLKIRAIFISIYKNNEVLTNMLLKFILTFISIFSIDSVTNISSTMLVLIIAVSFSLVSIILSVDIILICLMMLILFIISKAGLVLTSIVGAIFIMSYVLYIRLFSKEVILIFFTMLLIPSGAVYLVPLVGALFFGFGASGAIAVGYVFYNIFIQLNTLMSQDLSAFTVPNIYLIVSTFLENTIYNEKMLVSIAILTIVFLVVYLIRILSIAYAPYVAIFFGSIINIFGFLLAQMLINLDLNIIVIVSATISCALIAFFVSFMSRVLDYTKTQVVQFEDETNYYFVKVIPKIETSSKANQLQQAYMPLQMDINNTNKEL